MNCEDVNESVASVEQAISYFQKVFAEGQDKDVAHILFGLAKAKSQLLCIRDVFYSETEPVIVLPDVE